jgi:hypothetical protein
MFLTKNSSKWSSAAHVKQDSARLADKNRQEHTLLAALTESGTVAACPELPAALPEAALPPRAGNSSARLPAGRAGLACALPALPEGAGTHCGGGVGGLGAAAAACAGGCAALVGAR